jgi:hypothetical protein
MYNHGGSLGASGALGSGGSVLGVSAAKAAALPFTGLNVIWLLLAAFALISAGSALLRIVPRRQG